MSHRTFNPLFWTLTQVGYRLRPIRPASLKLTAVDLPEPQTVTVPTRHGPMRSLIYRPAGSGANETPTPVLMHMHGGGFINWYPEQDSHIARFLVANLGVTAVLPDYDTAPKVRYPVAEEEMLDVALWLQNSGHKQRWDGKRLLLSGTSAGAKLAINVCQQLPAVGANQPLAVALTAPVTDFTRTDRTSSIARPAISPLVQRMVVWGYFPDAERHQETLASPRFDDSLAEIMPPTLVQTGEFDTLAPEGADLARTLKAGGVDVTYHQYPQADHSFYAAELVETVREMLSETASFFQGHLAAKL